MGGSRGWILAQRGQDVKILLLVVAYNNHEQVLSFLKAISARESTSVQVALCDNSREPPDGFADSVTSLLVRREAVVVNRPDNPGYLEGGLAALDAFREKFGDSSWIILSNTDVQFLTPLSVLLECGIDPEQTPVVLAPRILEGPQSVPMNPHQVKKKRAVRIRLDAFICSTTFGAFMYLCFHQISGRFRRTFGGHRVSGGSEYSGTMFSPFGAAMVFSAAFLRTATIPRHVPLLSEEHVVGVCAQKAGCEVRMYNDLVVHHDGHGVTGRPVTIRRARMLSRALQYIARLEADGRQEQ